jgi:hypothetical protein
MLERNALADLWKHTLSQIPSTYGRLVYLASLREANSGVYRHHGLSAAFGREESLSALRKSHEDTFREWLSLPMSAKSADLITHFRNVEENPRQVLTYLARATPYLSQIPDSASPAQRRQFKMEMETLLELIKNDSAASGFRAQRDPRDLTDHLNLWDKRRILRRDWMPDAVARSAFHRAWSTIRKRIPHGAPESRSGGHAQLTIQAGDAGFGVVNHYQ